MVDQEFKHLQIEKLTLDTLHHILPATALSPREQARRERDEEIGHAIDLLMTMPDDGVLLIELKANQKLSTMRAAVHRVIDLKKADEMLVSVRAGRRIYLSRKEIPGGRGRKPHPRRSGVARA